MQKTGHEYSIMCKLVGMPSASNKHITNISHNVAKAYAMPITNGIGNIGKNQIEAGWLALTEMLRKKWNPLKVNANLISFLCKSTLWKTYVLKKKKKRRSISSIIAKPQLHPW